MFVDLCLCYHVQDFTLVERFQIFALADGTVAARRVSSDLLIVSLLQSSPAFSIENIDHLFRNWRWWGRNNPSGETVNAEHWQDHSLTARHRAPSEPDLGRDLECM